MPDNITYGTSGNDNLSGGNGKDTIYGLGGDDIIHGGNGVDRLFGGDGNDQLFGDNGSDDLTGGAGDDDIDGLNGFDIAYYSGAIGEYSFYSAAGYLHVVHLGGLGADGHDRLIRVERLVFADRTIDIGSGHNAPVAGDDHVFITEDAGTYSSGAASVKDNDFDFDGDALTVTGGVFVGTYGTLTLNADGTYSYALNASAQALAQGANVTDSFNYTVTDNDGSDTGALVFHVAGVNDAPVAHADTASTSENATILVNVLANDTDVDTGAVLTVTTASAPSGQGTASVVGNQVQFDPGTDFDDLAVGQTEAVVVSYGIADEHGATGAASIALVVTGTNDGPVAVADTAATTDHATVLVDALANDTDADNGAALTVTAASAPSGQGTASVVGNQVQFDPGTDFDDLAVGDSEQVVVGYDIEDEHGAPASSTITITVTNVNDAPVANPDTATTNEDAAVLIDVLANDTDADSGAIVVVADASVPLGQGTVTIDENQVRFDPGTDFDYLGEGETAEVVVNYTIEDEFGAQSSSTVTITVEGSDDAASGTPTEGSDTLIGTSGADVIDALGGDDTVFGRGGDDTLLGGDGSDQVHGEGGADTIDGGADDDLLSGGNGNDTLAGSSGNDTVLGEDGDDTLSGGDGIDVLAGDAGDDVVAGGNDDDFMSGGDGGDQLSGEGGDDFISGDSGDDQLSGGAGSDGLDGGDGDDTLAGGIGNDSLFDLAGTNSFAGGDGDDFVFAGSTDGAQAIDAGDGNDTIRLLDRYFASSVTTGAGSDMVELLNADAGTETLTVTDFTPGAGGDQLALSSGEGSLLGLLEGWDGSANPFGAGFLQLQQSGADTVLQWDQDGATGGASWETLVVFENTTAGDFTEANFAPSYDPDGSAPAGATITGTADSETLVGTIGADTIDALGGDDTVSGGAGADSIQGGDGADVLNGEADDDTLDGGNDDDFLLGGDGTDQLSGDAGNDTLFGENGGDQLSGGDGDDSLDGGEGDDTLDGGGGDDFLASGVGTDALAGGDGNDTFRHVARTYASTITTGTGSDAIDLLQADLGAAVLTVTDFTTGGGGDTVRLSGDEGSLLTLLEGWDGNSNPFGSGFLRLQQSGADTVLQWDRNGATGGASWETLIAFENTTVGDFTEANFAPGFDPDGGAPAGETITGTSDNDTLTGTIGNDTIDALGGDDTVYAGAGDDLIQGGDGQDFVLGEAGDDTVAGGDGTDFLLGEAGDDTVAGGNDDDFLWGGDGNDALAGEAGSDALAGESGDDQLSGGDGGDTLDGGEGNDTLTGGDGDDFLNGGAGADASTSGAGSDVVYFLSADQGADTVTDFAVGSDKIYVSADGFGGGLIWGETVSLVSGGNPAATGTSGQFLFDTDDGRLLWDADGTGSGSAALIATFSNLPALSAADFVVV